MACYPRIRLCLEVFFASFPECGWRPFGRESRANSRAISVVARGTIWIQERWISLSQLVEIRMHDHSINSTAGVTYSSLPTRAHPRFETMPIVPAAIFDLHISEAWIFVGVDAIPPHLIS
jgi:hypothetical protein